MKHLERETKNMGGMIYGPHFMGLNMFRCHQEFKVSCSQTLILPAASMIFFLQYRTQVYGVIQWSLNYLLLTSIYHVYNFRIVGK